MQLFLYQRCMTQQIPTITDFRKTIWDYYWQHGRSFEWRHAEDPYCIFISEVMLQQTQTARVIQKYKSFLHRFATVESLASASLKDVLQEWQGLGYNRRGMYLYQAAQEIVAAHAGIVPDDPLILVNLPGIGPNTAASICAFAYNKPTLFIETNIRTVFIYFFFAGKEKVHDKEILPFLELALDTESPREWYYALMDYGVMLKKMLPNPSRKSAHHTKQSKFEGSDRQIRGMILKKLTHLSEPIDEEELFVFLDKEIERVRGIIGDMVKERLVRCEKKKVSIL